MKRPILAFLVLYMVADFCAKPIYSQDTISLLNSGLQVHILIDCSKSLWASGDPEDLRRCQKQVLKEVVLSLRPSEDNGDCVAIYFFSDRLSEAMPLQRFGQDKAIPEKMLRLFDGCIKNSTSDATRNLSRKYTNLSTVLDQAYDVLERASCPIGVQQTKVLLIISDGINDPNDTVSRSNTELDVAPLRDEDGRITKRLSEFKHLSKTEVFMIQLPYCRPEPDLLRYAHRESWYFLLRENRFAAANLQAITSTVAEAFRRMRSVAFKEICVQVDAMQYDKWKFISGDLEFWSINLPLPPIDIEIRLKAILDEHKNAVWNDEDVIDSGQRKRLLFLTRLSFTTRRQRIPVIFQLPDEVKLEEACRFLVLDIIPKNVQTIHGKYYLSFSFRNACDGASFKRAQ